MDIIFIRELRIEALIGVHPWERQIRQTLLLDLELGTDIRPAAASDQLADTLDYQAITRRIAELALASHFALLEALGELLAERIRAEFAVPWLRLRLSKPGALDAAAMVGIVIERGHRD